MSLPTAELQHRVLCIDGIGVHTRNQLEKLAIESYHIMDYPETLQNKVSLKNSLYS